MRRAFESILLTGILAGPVACRGAEPKSPAGEGPTSAEPAAAKPEHDHHHDHAHAHGSDHDRTGMQEGHRHAGPMNHRFEDAEAWAKHFESEERLAWQKPDEVVASLDLPPDAKIADIGAGTGYFSVRLARAVPQGVVYAQDVEPDMVRYLEERAGKEGLDNLRPVRGTGDDPALPEPVDVVFLTNVYHHIPARPAYFAKVRDRLAPGGRLVIVDFKKDAPADAPGPGPEHRIAQDQVVDELSQAGFALARADRELLPYQYVLTFTVD